MSGRSAALWGEGELQRIAQAALRAVGADGQEAEAGHHRADRLAHQIRERRDPSERD